MDTLNITGLRIESKRQELRLSLRKLAALCNLNPSSLSKMESGLQCPNRDTLIKLAKHLQTSTDYLCGLTDDSTHSSMHILIGVRSDQPAPAIQRTIDNSYVTGNSLFDFFQKELLNVYAHVEYLKKTGKYDPIGDETVRSLSESAMVDDSCIKAYEDLLNEICSLCNTGTGNHSFNVRSVRSFIEQNSDKIKIK